MDAVEFLREWDRMRDSMDDCCEGCDLSKWGVGCKEYAQKHPEDAVIVVEGWIKKNPIKTRQSEFLKTFPDASIGDDGVVKISPCAIDQGIREDICCIATTCTKCRKDYWLTEVGDEK